RTERWTACIFRTWPTFATPRLREMYRRISVLARTLILVVAASLSVAAGVSAQTSPARGRIEGTALDSATSAARLGVIVTLNGTGMGAVSDVAGHFVLANVPAGTYTLNARQLSARTLEMPVVVKGGETTPVVLRIASAPVTLNAVHARARSPERDRFELSPNIGAISLTKNASKNVPQFGEPDVMRVVQLLPGVNARNDFSSGFNVRGGESDQNLILLDGYPIYNPFHLGGLFSTFLEETVGSIDLLTGGFGARYGGRLSSILDVTSSEPDKPGIHGSSNISVIASSLTVGSASPDGRSSWTLSGRRTYADKFIAAISDNNFPYHFSDAQFHGVKALGKGELKLELTGYAGADVLDGDIASFSDSASSGGSPGSFIFGWTNQLVGVTLRNVWRDSVHVPLFGVADSVGVEQHVSLTRFATELDLGSGALSLSNSIHDFRLAGAVHWHRASHERRLGYEASGYAIRYDVLSSASPSPLFQLAQHPTSSAIYYQESWKPSRKWITEAGVRVEHLTGRDFTAIEPRVSLKYFVSPDLALSAAVGDYSQALHSLNREDIPIRIFDFWVASDQYTPVSTARHYVLGLERWIGPLRFARVEGWVKKYNNLLEQNTADDPGIRGDEFLVSTGVSYGFDVLLRQLEIGPLGGWLAYTYGISSRERAGTTYWPGHDRRHNLNLVATYKPGAHYTLSARLGVSSGTPYTDIVGQVIRRSYNPHTHLFDDDRDKEIDPVGGAHNGSRYPLFQRLDLGVSRSGEWRGMQLSPYFSIVNAYNASNVFIYTFDYTLNPPTRNTVSQFPFLPSFGLTIGF
ncbi:MAG: TonB-dependent receptor plug, partial [Gemmatimonadetes bacterium]|nr:TonB-dependent receptor plug [Gemmatimonadota bacterium]